jgi:GNAT superfamily N-acetyltransferase
MLQITHAATDEQFKQVWQLRAEMGRWDADQAQQLGLDPAEVLAFFYPTDDHASLRANAPPEGEWLLATYAGKAAGCGAFRRIDANTCELQYVYVRDEYRGKRIGRLMVEQLVAKARAIGYKVMRLETTTFMKEARALYASIGFRPRGPYYEVLKVFEPFTVFMELTLGPPDVR